MNDLVEASPASVTQSNAERDAQGTGASSSSRGGATGINEDHNRSSQSGRCSKLFVAGLPPSLTDDEELRLHFSQFGPVLAGNIVLDRRTNRSRCFGFVTFEDPDDAENLLRKQVDPSRLGEPPVGCTEIRGTVVEIKPATTARTGEAQTPYSKNRKARRRRNRITGYSSAYAYEFEQPAAPFGVVTPFLGYDALSCYCNTCPMWYWTQMVPMGLQQAWDLTPRSGAQPPMQYSYWDSCAEHGRQHYYGYHRECVSQPERLDKARSVPSSCSDDPTESVTEASTDGDDLNDLFTGCAKSCNQLGLPGN